MMRRGFDENGEWTVFKWLRMMFVGIVLGCFVSVAVAAEFKSDAGQPFCKTEQDLMKYLVAGLTKDRSMKWDCALLGKGENVSTIELLSEGTVGLTYRARVKGRSGEGYIMQVKK